MANKHAGKVYAIDKIVGRNALTVRESRGWTGEQAGVAVGLNRFRISAIENPKASLRVDTLAKIAAGYGISAFEFLKPNFQVVGASKKQAADLSEVLGSNMRYLREKMRLTLEDVGELAGMQKMRIYHLEKHLHNPELRTVEMIAKALGVQPYMLLHPYLRDLDVGI